MHPRWVYERRGDQMHQVQAIVQAGGRAMQSAKLFERKEWEV